MPEVPNEANADEGAAAARRATARAEFESVMTFPPPDPFSPYSDLGVLGFVFGEVWNRPGLDRRARRWITLASVAVCDSVVPIEMHVYAALKSGEISVAEMQEFVLHLAVYSGWPKASMMEGTTMKMWAQVRKELGADAPDAEPADALPVGGGIDDPEARRVRGQKSYLFVNTTPPPPPTTPFFGPGILDFVFSEMWTRPGLSMRDRRFITLACVGAADAVTPIESHVYAALKTGDVTLAEMQEFVLHFAVYCGWPKASMMEATTMRMWARIQKEAAAEGTASDG